MFPKHIVENIYKTFKYDIYLTHCFFSKKCKHYQINLDILQYKIPYFLYQIYNNIMF